MWNLVFESLLSLFKEDDPVKINGYADDAALLCSGENLGQIYMYLQRALDKVSMWSVQHGLTFSAAKSVTVCFTLKRKFRIPKPLTLNGTAIPESNNVRYLGVILDSKLSWKKHMQAKVRNAKFQLHSIRNAMGKIWGAPPKMVRWAYTGIVRPALLYGALVWAKISETAWAESEFNKINRLALLAMGHFRRSTPTAGMEVLNYIRPLKYQVMMEASMGYLRTSHIHKNIKSSKHLVFASKWVDKLPLSKEEIDEGTLTFNWDRKYQIIIEDGEPDFMNNVRVYTDGSLVKDNAGSGFLIEKRWENTSETGKFALGPQRSVFQAEVYAVNKAVEQMLSSSTTGRKITIHVDSQAALQALSSSFITKKCVRRVVRNLNKLGHQNLVSLRWVKSHVGHNGNEIADMLAKSGASESMHFELDRPCISKKVVKKMVREKADDAWNMEWKSSRPCRQTKLWFPNIDRKKAMQITQLKRPQHSVVTQLITGHSYLNRHQSLMTPGMSPNCQYCQEDEEQTAFHVIAECPCFWQARWSTFGESTLRHSAWTVGKVVKFIREVKLPDGSHLLGDLVDQEALASTR
jgi:ribonuclease HI